MSQRAIAFQPGQSWLHRLHPLVKAAWLVVLSILLFASQSVAIVVAMLLFAMVALRSSGLSLARRRGIVLLVITGISLGLVHILFQNEGNVLTEFGPIVITRTGLSRAVYISGRFLSIVLLSYVYVLSTDPNKLAYSLMQAGLPYRYGFALVTALRLVPIFEQEAVTVTNAQRARGIGHDVRGPRQLLTRVRQLLLPLISSALGKIDVLAVSMEGRGFGRYPQRTYLRTVDVTRNDRWALVLLMVTLISSTILII
mgnify:CR=1 FL=1